MENKLPSREFLLRASFKKLMNEILDTCSQINLQSIMNANQQSLLSQKSARFMQDNFTRTVFDNSSEEFECILAEKNIPLLLENIDNTLEKDIFSPLKDSSYNFTHIDPQEEVKRVQLLTQQAEIIFLRQNLAYLQEKTNIENQIKAELEEQLQNYSNNYQEDLNFFQEINQES